MSKKNFSCVHLKTIAEFNPDSHVIKTDCLLHKLFKVNSFLIGLQRNSVICKILPITENL